MQNLGKAQALGALPAMAFLKIIKDKSVLGL